VEGAISRLRIATTGLRQPVGRLSGGNQQKAVIAKWLLSEGQIFLLYDITRGVDIGAKAEIYRIVLGLAERGATILYYSTDLDELLRLCHRVAVFHDGSLAAMLDKSELTDRALVSAAFGRGAA
jgi:ribose transport system ATP-binding protein